MVRDSGEVASVDDPATVEFFPCPLGRQGVWMLFAQDPATLVQDIGVAGLRFRSPAAAGRDPGELVTNDYRVRMVFAEDPHAPGKKLTVGGLGLLPLAFLGADPGELVQGGQGPGMLGAKYPAPVAEDRVEDPPGFTEPAPLLVRDRPCEFVAGQQGPGIVRAQDADAFIEGFLVARFGGNYP
jgi:hypothetical protein